MTIPPSDFLNPHDVRVGNVYQVNDSRKLFIVTGLECQYAEVVDQDGRRPRRILLRALRSSRSKHGYTLVEETS